MSKKETKADLYRRIHEMESDIKTLIESDKIIDVLAISSRYKFYFEVKTLEEKINFPEKKAPGNGIFALIHFNNQCESCLKYGKENCLICLAKT